MAFLSALLAGQAGGAEQKISNYQDAVKKAADDKVAAQAQANWEAEQARLSSTADRAFNYTAGRDAKTDAADDVYTGKGLTPPPGLLPKNHGIPLTPDQKANNALTVAAWYASKGANGKADEYERQARDYSTMSNNAAKNTLAADREKGLEEYRQSMLAQRNSQFNSKQSQQASQFAQSLSTKVSEYATTYAQRGQLANVNSADRRYIAQLAGAIRVGVNSDDEAVKEAIAQYDMQGRVYDAQVRSLDPAISGAARAPGAFVPPGGGSTINIYGGGMPQAPTGSVPTAIPGANGQPPIPPNPNAPAVRTGGLVPNYGGGGAGAGAAKTAAQGDPAIDPIVSDAVNTVKAAGLTLQTLPKALKIAHPNLTPAQITAIVAKVSLAMGTPLPLPAGGMRATGTASSSGGAAPASPFQIPIR